jgi:phosphoribosylanthranilate isomerase
MQGTISIKVCGLKDPSNVKIISGCGADYLGFIFYPHSKRFVGDLPDKMLFSGLPEGIKKTGVFVDEAPGRIIELAKYAKLDVVQLHGNESVSCCRSIKSSGLTVIKAFGADACFDPHSTDQFSDVCDFYLFDTKHADYGGSGIKFDWNILNDYSFKKPFFISGGIGPEDKAVRSTVKNDRFFGVDINSRFETSPGIKDANLVRYFINEIKA